MITRKEKEMGCEKSLLSVDEFCQYVGYKNDGPKKRICGLSEPWYDKQTTAMAFADRGLASCVYFDSGFAASNLSGNLVWDAGSFFTA